MGFYSYGTCSGENTFTDSTDDDVACRRALLYLICSFSTRLWQLRVALSIAAILEAISDVRFGSTCAKRPVMDATRLSALKRFTWERPLSPTTTTSAVAPAASSFAMCVKFNALVRLMFTPPQRPRSVVIGMNVVFLETGTSMWAVISWTIPINGRAALRRVSAPFSLDTATICIALVIFAIFAVDLIRPSTSLRVAMLRAACGALAGMLRNAILIETRTPM